MRIFPLGDNALTIEFGNEISAELNQKARSVAAFFDALPFPGFIESVPAYSSATIFYNCISVRNAFPNFPTAFEAVKALVQKAPEDIIVANDQKSRFVEIPVIVGANTSLDLDEISAHAGIPRDETLKIFFKKTYFVYMLGFLPGFAYMGEVDERIATPRKQTPRLRVPKGSIGIAGKQTGIYPLESPGGWQIIGRTEIEMFTPDSDEPCLLRPGDQVRFVRIDSKKLEVICEK
ncbi:MAG: 5-oxoprolinase subunit PxpB [Pyrinomonadaceae bacterium]